jgi:hypothetical protein
MPQRVFEKFDPRLAGAWIAPYLPAVRSGGRPRTTDLRAVLNAIFYLLRTGCQWRLLPREFPRPGHRLPFTQHNELLRQSPSTSHPFPLGVFAAWGEQIIGIGNLAGTDLAKLVAGKSDDQEKDGQKDRRRRSIVADQPDANEGSCDCSDHSHDRFYGDGTQNCALINTRTVSIAQLSCGNRKT